MLYLCVHLPVTSHLPSQVPELTKQKNSTKKDCLGLSLVEFSGWEALQQKVYCQKIRNDDYLKHAVLDC